MCGCCCRLEPSSLSLSPPPPQYNHQRWQNRYIAQVRRRGADKGTVDMGLLAVTHAREVGLRQQQQPHQDGATLTLQSPHLLPDGTRRKVSFSRPLSHVVVHLLPHCTAAGPHSPLSFSLSHVTREGSHCCISCAPEMTWLLSVGWTATSYAVWFGRWCCGFLTEED